MTRRRIYADYLRDILDAAEKAARFTEGMSREAFEADDKTTFAVIRALEIIGEAAKTPAREGKPHERPVPQSVSGASAGGGVISGAVFSFISSFDQFPISLLLSGVGTTTLPIQIFDYLRFSFDPTAAAVSTINILITLGVVLLTERLVGLESLRWRGAQA